mmetsp:Transcript_13854/g.11826  ORF Transcript_13854/g.11826 Transcript_13854/m.11826 type:complete len:272 (+) Transcript_13854:9301-10116(+)
MYKIQLYDEVDETTLKNAFSLVTGLQQSRFVPQSMPEKFEIPDLEDEVVKEILETETVTYQFMLLQNSTSDEERPIDSVALLESNMHIFSEDITSIVTDYPINYYSYEVLEFPPEFSKTPEVTEVAEDNCKIEVSLKRNGTIYGIILPKGSEKPYPRQIKYGLNAYNFKVEDGYTASSQFVYPENSPQDVYLHQVVSFTGLFDNTEYEAHFVGENTLEVNPDIMEEHEIQTVTVYTQREFFIIPEEYSSASILKNSFVMTLVSIIIILCML